ncbi:MAG: patatin-like phospholipase family protein [Pseudomonadota bacterium]
MPFTDQRRALVRKLEQLEGAILWDASYEKDYLCPDDEAALRYAFALARISAVPVGKDVVDIGYSTDRYRNKLHALVAPAYEAASYPESAVGHVIPELRKLAREEREALLELFGPRLPEDALERALRHRPFGLALGGGGGVAYVFLGAFALMHEAGLVPDLIAGTSMGSILGAFRALEREFRPTTVREVIGNLQWRDLLRVFESGSRFGLPATFKLFLRNGIGRHFERDGRMLNLDEMAIPYRVVVGGISAAHLGDVNRYANLIDASEAHERKRWPIERIARALAEILQKPLKTIVLGGDELTRDFDVVDALGFSSSVPAIVHYDILREDPRMIEKVEALLQREGVARLVDGGVVDNLPARAVWEAVQGGAIGARDPFVLALDAFAPRIEFDSNVLFLPLMRLAAETSKTGYAVAHHVVSFRDVLSPLTVVPTEAQVAKAIATGRAQFEKHLPFVQKMLSPVPRGEGIVGES